MQLSTRSSFTFVWTGKRQRLQGKSECINWAFVYRQERRCTNMKDVKEASCATGKKRKGRSVGSSRLKSKGGSREEEDSVHRAKVSEKGKLRKLKKEGLESTKWKRAFDPTGLRTRPESSTATPAYSVRTTTVKL